MPPKNPQQTLMEAVATLTDEMSETKHLLAAMQLDVKATKELVEAWTTVKTMGRFIKWLSGIATGLAAIWLLARVGLTHLIGGTK